MLNLFFNGKQIERLLLEILNQGFNLKPVTFPKIHNCNCRERNFTKVYFICEFQLKIIILSVSKYYPLNRTCDVELHTFKLFFLLLNSDFKFIIYKLFYLNSMFSCTK